MTTATGAYGMSARGRLSPWGASSSASTSAGAQATTASASIEPPCPSPSRHPVAVRSRRSTRACVRTSSRAARPSIKTRRP